MASRFRWSLLALLGCLCIPPAAVPAQEGAAWERHMDAAQQAYRQGNHAEAERLLVDALKEAERFAPWDPRLAVNLNALGEIYGTQGRYAEAVPYLERALAIYERALGPDDPLVARTLGNYAILLRKNNRGAEAVRLEARAKAILSKLRKDQPTK